MFMLITNYKFIIILDKLDIWPLFTAAIWTDFKYPVSDLVLRYPVNFISVPSAVTMSGPALCSRQKKSVSYWIFSLVSVSVNKKAFYNSDAELTPPFYQPIAKP